MLKTLFVFLLLIFLIPCNAQDTTKTPGDSLIIYKDSLGIFNDTLSTSDTTGLLSTKKNLAKGDSLIPLFTGPLSENSYIITPKEIQFSGYRSTEDLLELYPFYYNYKYGSIGYSDTYSMGTQQTVYLQNGLPVAKTPYVTDLNLIQSENIDSVEFIPAPRSSLYSYGENLASINIITKDQLWVRPYTRIKYYQGAGGEAMFDGIFNSVLYNKLFAYLDVTNRKFDQIYYNTAFNSWQVTARLRYLFSNDLNVTASYSYGKLYKGLNGGVNIDSAGIDNNDLIFNTPSRTPVNYYLRDRDQKLHSYDIKLLTKPFKNFFTDASFYYHFYENDDNNIIDNPLNKTVYKSNAAGLMLRGYYDIEKYLNLNVNFQYEHEKANFNSYSLQIFTNPWLTQSGNTNNLNFSSIIDLHVSDIVKPSIFYMYSQNKGINNITDQFNPTVNDYNTKAFFNSFGGDVKIIPLDNVLLYAGYSISKLDPQTLYTLQLTASWQIKNLYVRGEFINRNGNFPQYYLLSGDLKTSNYAFSAALSYRLGSFLLESKSIWDKNYVNNLRAGIYFYDSLFVPNLLLKTGISLNFIGSRMAPYAQRLGYVNLNKDYTFDFTLAGEIRKSATIYFTWENILDRQYYEVPYYPMQGRNLRFGIAWELLN